MFVPLRNIVVSCLLSHRQSRTVNSILHKRLKATICEEEPDNLEVLEDSEYNQLAENFLRFGDAHRCLVLQPYVKWGHNKLEISPAEQLDEAVALIETLPGWSVDQKIEVALDNLERKTLFRTGNMQNIENTIQKNRKNISAVFVNLSMLKPVTNTILEENFQLPIFDRYKIVIQILKMHATSKHAKLQVALAELYYLQRKGEKSSLFSTMDSETLNLMFNEREQKLKKAILDVRNQRTLLRNKRRKLEYPIAAVVGYTNAGKTSLIKALTGERSLQPKNQLFATLDVTLHSGILPSGLKLLYVDTVGFISDIPTNLIECFIATLEDVIFADVVIHVEDLSSSCFEYKRKHVLKTLKNLANQSYTDATSDCGNIMDKVISVGNKCDLVDEIKFDDVIPVSAKNQIGLDSMRLKLETFILKATDRQKITVKTENGGDDVRWLYKHATVISEMPCEEDNQKVYVKIIISKANLEKFKYLSSRNK